MEKFKFVLTRTEYLRGEVVVEAETEKQAEELALDSTEIDTWSCIYAAENATAKEIENET